MSLLIKPAKIHPSWEKFYNDNICELEDISLRLCNFTPPAPKVLRFMSADLEKARVVIIGQDPYPAVGIATGLAFEAGGLDSWNKPFRQVSLKNILRNLYGVYTGKSPYTPYKWIADEILSGKFPILPPNRLFKSWEEQGVLLINTSLTCEIGKPASHRGLWRDFTNRLILHISSQRKNINWFLWGGHAKSLSPLILGGYIYKSRHPMMCSDSYEDDFLKNPCFKDTADIIDWRGIFK